MGRAIGHYGTAHRDEWAGMWLSEGIYFAAFTRNLDEHRARLEALVGWPAVRVVSARWTETDLERISEEVFERYQGSPGLTGVGLSSPTNRVRVTVRRVSLDLAAELRAAWPDQLLIEHGEGGRALSHGA